MLVQVSICSVCHVSDPEDQLIAGPPLCDQFCHFGSSTRPIWPRAAIVRTLLITIVVAPFISLHELARETCLGDYHRPPLHLEFPTFWLVGPQV